MHSNTYVHDMEKLLAIDYLRQDCNSSVTEGFLIKFLFLSCSRREEVPVHFPFLLFNLHGNITNYQTALPES